MFRQGDDSEISAAITYLLSPAAACITGSCIRVDGGAPNVRCWNPPKPLLEGLDHDASREFSTLPLDTPPRLLTEGVTKAPTR